MTLWHFDSQTLVITPSQFCKGQWEGFMRGGKWGKTGSVLTMLRIHRIRAQEEYNLLFKVLHLPENIKVLGNWKEKIPRQNPKQSLGVAHGLVALQRPGNISHSKPPASLAPQEPLHSWFWLPSHLLPQSESNELVPAHLQEVLNVLLSERMVEKNLRKGKKSKPWEKETFWAPTPPIKGL